jgi:GntR family transcriptional repressor for pyruvate dehydrogenase complex
MQEPDLPVTAAAPQPGRKGRQTSLVDRVYDQLLNRIRKGEYPPESKLPPENDLAAMFDVSRPIVRAALGRLRDEGTVNSRQGAGSFVKAQLQPVTGLGYAPVETIADIQRCYEFRLTIEPAAAYYAALRRDQKAIETITRALGQLGDATRVHLHRSDVDFAFHKAVADAANNHYYSSSMEALREHVAVGMHLHGLSLMGPKEKLNSVFEEHRRICNAIVEGRAEDARDAMRIHLEGSRDRLFEGRILDLSL